MNKLIVLTGDVATGKSHFLSILDDRYHLKHFSKDEYKERLDILSPISEKDNHKQSLLAKKYLFKYLRRYMRTKKDCVIEANFHQNDLNKIEKMAKNRYEILYLNLIGSVDVLYTRYNKRMQDEKRHPIHNSNGFEKYDVFLKYYQDTHIVFDKPNAINISTDDFSYQDDPSLYKKIDEFLNIAK